MVLESKNTAEEGRVAAPEAPAPGRCNCALHAIQYALEERIQKLEKRVVELEDTLARQERVEFLKGYHG